MSDSLGATGGTCIHGLVSQGTFTGFSPRVDLENQTSTLCAGLDLSFCPLEMPYKVSECTLAIG